MSFSGDGDVKCQRGREAPSTQTSRATMEGRSIGVWSSDTTSRYWDSSAPITVILTNTTLLSFSLYLKEFFFCNIHTASTEQISDSSEEPQGIRWYLSILRTVYAQITQDGLSFCWFCLSNWREMGFTRGYLGVFLSIKAKEWPLCSGIGVTANLPVLQGAAPGCSWERRCPSWNMTVLTAPHCPTSLTLPIALAVPGWLLLALLCPLPSLLLILQLGLSSRAGMAQQRCICTKGLKPSVLRNILLSRIEDFKGLIQLKWWFCDCRAHLQGGVTYRPWMRLGFAEQN